MNLMFHWPWALLLLPLPWFIMRLRARSDERDEALRVPHLQRWQSAQWQGQTRASGASVLTYALLWTCWIALVLALTRPYQEGDAVEVPISGRDLLLAVDLSPSMEIEDMELRGQTVNRLTLVKEVVGDFISRRQGDRLGLVVFADNAYLHAPLTFDRATVKQYLQDSFIGFAGNQRTAIGDALGISVKQLMDQPESSRVVILITDGANNAGNLTPDQAAELAAHYNVRVYTIGLGSERMLRRSLFSTIEVNPSKDMDEASLLRIAQLTGGEFFRARNTDELAQIYRLIDQLEPVEQAPQLLRPLHERYHYPLALALILSLLLALQQRARRA